MVFRPQTFANVEDPQELRRYLLELQQELARALGETNQLSPVVTSATYAANYDEIVRIDPPTGGTTVILPPPSIAKAGATVTLTVVGDGGQITLECVDGQVNNASSFAFQAGVGDVVCRLDGPRGWFIPSAELSSSGPADAQYYVGAADGSLPNARLGTASTEITPSHAVANVVTWALNTASVVLAKLQDLTGLSVLGRAANSTGVMAAITASAARQVLQVNDAGTSLAWGDPVEVRERGTDVGDAYALDVVNGPGMTAHASVASRVGALQFCLAAHRIKTVPATGIIDTSDWNDYDAIYFTGAQPEVQNIPQPTDPDGNVYEKVLWLIGSTVVAPLTIRHNTGTGTGRIFCPNLRDSEQFQLSSSQLVYNTAENRWFIVANTSVVAEANNDGTLLIGRSLNFMNAPAGLTWTLAKAAGEIRITPTLASIPLTALADQADDTGLRNISGSPAPPTASALSSWVDGNKLTYNSTSHYWQWEGMEGRISGADAGDFVGIDFTNGSGNVTFSLDTGAGGTFGVVANVDLSGVTYTAGDGLDLSGQEFSVDVSDFAGYGLSDDGSNNLRLGPFSAINSVVSVDQNNLSRPSQSRVLRLDPGASLSLTGIDGGYEGEMVFVLKGGNSDHIDLPDGSGSSSAGNQLQFNDDHSRRLVKRDDVAPFVYFDGNWYHVGSPWPFYDDSTQADRDIPVVNSSGEWGRENLTTAVDGAAPGRLIQITEYSSGSGTHTYNSATARVFVQLVHGGGGGGSAASCSSAQASAGGGGGGSRLSESWMTPGGATDSYSVGAGGSAGTAGGSGGAGGASSFGSFSPSNATGLGGAGGAATGSGVLRFSAGGGNNTGNGGSPGGHGVAIGGSGSTGASAGGVGGPGPWGGGGGGATIIENGATGTGTGVFGTTPGGGGSGASNVGTGSNVNGGGGAGGFIRVWEFT